MLGFIYAIILHLLALAAMPKLLYSMVVHEKYCHSFFRRFGWQFPNVEKGNRFLIWVHAVSVGEAKAISPVVRRLKKTHPDCLILVSSVTETGHVEAKKSIPEADFHVYLPYDFSYVIGPIVHRVKPDLVLLTETDFWYNFQTQAKAVGARVVVVSGKLSEASCGRMKAFSWFSKHLLEGVDLFCLQEELYQKRFEEVGVPKEKMVVTGNIKLDDHYPVMTQEEKNSWKKDLGITSQNEVLVVGSSHDPEEKLMLDTLREVWKKHPQLKALIVPRHPERFATVAQLLAREKIPFGMYSQKEKITGNERVILIDTIGKLRSCYQLADIALVAGSYTSKVGGHNILEPSAYGIPVIYGPFMHSQPQLTVLMKEHRAGRQVSPEQLKEVLLEMLDNEKERREMGAMGLKIFQSASGAVERSFLQLEHFLPQNGK